MKQICKKYAKICYPYAINMLNICSNMQEYDKNMHKYAIVKYAQICTNMQKKYAKNMHKYATICQGGVKVILELSNKNCDHGSHIRKVQLRKASRLKLRVYYM